MTLFTGIAGVLLLAGGALLADTSGRGGRSVGDERVVVDVDLTRGQAGPGRVTGGVWDRGWMTTGAPGARIVFDAGQPIANGRLEVSFTADRLPWQAEGEKINFAGLHEHPSLDQEAHDGDLFYARTGNASYRFAAVKAAGRAFDRTEYEPRVGANADWIADGRTVMTIRLEWRDGVPRFVGPNGAVTDFPRDIVGGDTPVDRLRYAFIGSDEFTGLTAAGLRFTRVRLVDLGPHADGPPPELLRVHAGGRALETASGRPVFLLADTAWSLVARATREEIEAYLRHRRGQRFNAVTFVLFSPGSNELVGSPRNAYGDAPFVDAAGKPDPTRPLTTAGAAPADQAAYDYWDHVDYAIAECRRLGLYAIVLPTWGSGVTGGHNGERPEEIVFDAANARAYGRWLAERYRDEPHVIWMLGGDRSAVYADRDFRPVFRAMADGLAGSADTTAGGRPDGLRRPLISFHPRKDAPNSSEWFHDDPWLTFNSIQDWPDVQLAAVAADRTREPAKPTWLFEGRYEGYYKRNYRPDQWNDWPMRLQAWQTVLAGAFGHTYGHERVFGFGQDGADWKAFLDAPGARSMTHLAKFMNSLKHGALAGLEPDATLIEGDPGAAERLGSTRILAARTASRGLAVFYTAAGRDVRVALDRLSAGPLHAFWFNPRTGGWHVDGRESVRMQPFAADVAAGPGTPARAFDPPGAAGEGQDWVLVLCRNPALY